MGKRSTKAEPERLSRSDAQRKLRDAVEYGTIEQHPHFKTALADDGLTYPDILPILNKGLVLKEPEFDVRFQQWRYKVEGRTVDGRQVTVVFAFLESGTLLITAFTIR